MIDCPNGDIRDLLPDLVHERLDAAARARTTMHVTGCAACTAEVALLERIRASVGRSGTAPVNVDRVVRALPNPLRRSRPVYRIAGVRAAAAIAFLVIGAGLLRDWQSNRNEPIETYALDSASPTDSTTGQERSVAPGPPARASQRVLAVREASLGDDFTDLSDRELESLLGDLDSFEAITRAEPAAIEPIILESGR